ncbi:MAG: TonB-dependent receptor [Niabella sp.]|nr:MAG: TonB-dependent receptor [Niabella sp.]
MERSVSGYLENLNNDKASVKVQGTILDEKGNPLANVNIQEKGATNGTTTDADGNFTITVKDNNAILVVSSIGFETREVAVGESPMTILLKSTAESMAEVVVVGYGTQKKANLTGAVSTVSASAIEQRPVSSTGQALQGLVPGLNLSTTGLGGELNQNMSMNIRGIGTIGSGSNASPLVLIDGMEGDINAINIQDIASISVLKDAGASAIYGSRAAFGVILVTTKKGKAGKPVVNYNNSFRWTSPLNMPKMLDSYRFAMYYNEAAFNDGSGPIFSDIVVQRIKDYMAGKIDSATHRDPNPNNLNWPIYTASNANTNWFKFWYNDAALAQTHNLSLSGGNEKNQYYVSAGYLGQDGLLKIAPDWLKRYTITGKINSKISDHVSFGYTSRFVREVYDKPSHMFDLFYHNIARRWPTLPIKDPNGHYTNGTEIPQMIDGGRYKEVEDWNYQQARLTIAPLKGWNINAELNYRIYNNNTGQNVLPAYGYDVNNKPIPLGVGWNSGGYTYVAEYNRKEDYFNSNIYSDYSFDIKQDHKFKVLLGFNSELNKFRTIAGSRSGLITPLVPTINTAANESKATEGQYQHWATAGFFGRLNYNYKEKYLLEANARYDGTSRFLRDQRWNLFPSLSLGWNVAKENFWPGNINIQEFKVRASYGELGNQNTSSWYPFYLTQPYSIGNGGWLLAGDKPNTASAPGLISTTLTWERVQSFNYGIDMAALNNRLTLVAEYYKRKTYNMVGPAPELPVILGTGVPRINNTDLESKGFELEIGWKDRVGELGYNIKGILSDDQQTVTRYPNPTGNIGSYYNGRRIGDIWGYTTVGIAKTQAEMDAHLAKANQNALGSNWQAGDIMFADLNGDGKINGGAGVLGNTGDRTIIGNSTPRYRYSVDVNLDWKGFDFRMFWQGVAKRDWMPNGPYFWGTNGNMWQAAGFEEHLDFFRDENSPMVKAGVAEVNLNSYFPRPYFDRGGKNTQTQTKYLQSAAYLRLKALQLGYTLPNNLITNLRLSKVRLYVSGENLLTFTKMTKAFDPETVGLSGWNDGKTYPLGEVYSCGISVTF